MGALELGIQGLRRGGVRIQRANMRVPRRIVQAVTTSGGWVFISFLLTRIQASAVQREATTMRSPVSEG
jgi:hypothetical protein